MSTVYKIPASKLPAELRGDYLDDELVTVTIKRDETPFPNLTEEQFDALFAESYAQKARGEGTVCKTPEDIDAYFDAIRARVDAKYKNA